MGLLASLGLAGVLCAITAAGLWAAQVTASASEAAGVSAQVSAAFERTRHALDLEAYLQSSYATQSDPATQTRFEAARVEFTTGVQEAVAQSRRNPDHGGPEQAGGTSLLAAHARFVASARSYFRAVDAGDTVRAVLLGQNITPQYLAMSAALDRLAAHEQAAASAAQRTLTDTVRAVRQVTVLSLIVGLLCMSVCLLILRRARRQLEMARRSVLLRLEQTARTDPLTGLGNRRAFEEAYERVARRAQRAGSTFVLALLDVDNFKALNDQYGHAHGDHVLSTLGRLLGALRPTESAFRLGGDEFAILLDHPSEEEALAVCVRLRRGLTHLVPAVTVSIGLARGGQTTWERTALCAQADAALYAAKQRGRDAVVGAAAADHNVAGEAAHSSDGHEAAALRGPG